MDFILENLAIGNYQEAIDAPSSIDALLCVAQEIDIKNPKVLFYYKVAIVDMHPIEEEQLKKAIEWVKDNLKDHKIMVFCNTGIGRSSSVVVAYLCCELDYWFGEAVEYVANIRPYMSLLPNLLITIKAVKNQMKHG